MRALQRGIKECASITVCRCESIDVQAATLPVVTVRVSRDGSVAAGMPKTISKDKSQKTALCAGDKAGFDSAMPHAVTACVIELSIRI